MLYVQANFVVEPTLQQNYVLTVSGRLRPGLAGWLIGFVSQIAPEVTEIVCYDDKLTDRSYLRLKAAAPDRLNVVARLTAALDGISPIYGLSWDISEAGKAARVLLMVSKFDHCLADLLHRWRIGELLMVPTAIVSNHPRETYPHLKLDGIPFYHLPVIPATKRSQEAALWSLIQASGSELVVLARYMQILSPELVEKLSGRCINIHHSLLPAFKGRKPYHEAHARGVKIIGATAHYVTQDLDEGPIIEQDIERISHVDTLADLLRKGRNVECRVLASAVRSHIERRIILDGNRVIVFQQ